MPNSKNYTAIIRIITKFMQNFKMTPFLHQVASQLIEKHTSFDNLRLILPSRRAIVFMRAAFLELTNKPGWLPEFYSLEDFIQELGAYQKLDQIDLIFELYEVHREIEREKAETFEDFISWGSMLLQDMNEIDRYMVDGNELFGFLTEAKAIETWNPETGELTEFQSKYLRFYRQLKTYYQLFRERLIQKKQVYQGLGFRMVAENLQANKIDVSHINQVYFIGFNALTKAEESIMTYFVKEKNAEQLWDADAYYLNDPLQEAGLFLRQHQNKSEKPLDWVYKDLLEGEKKISIYGVAGNVGQAKLIGTLLDNNQSAKEIQTAVVLADETILLPVLQSIPQKTDRINVTMGYPLRAATFYSWFESYLLIFRNYGSEDESTNSYDLGKLLLFMNHQNSQFLDQKCIEAIESCTKSIKDLQLFKVDSKQLKALNDLFENALFPEKKPTSQEIVRALLAIIHRLQNNKATSLNGLNTAFLAQFLAVFNRLEQLVDQKPFELKVEGLIQLYRQLVSKESVDFIGEPLGGLQIMGVLESRTLDFENIIISSVNEGILPSGKSVNSLIPFDIKKKFQLPSYKEKDAIFAYHFYRLLQRAKNISILYNTKVDPLQGGEKSRFISQLLYEMPHKNKQVTIEEKQISTGIPVQKEEVELIFKEDFEINAILEHLKKGLSPSAINTYISCPLDYYFKYVLKLKELEIFQQDIEDRTLGTIVHDSLELLYQPFIGQILDEKSLKQAKSLVASTVENQFIVEIKSKPQFGNKHLSYEVACKMVQSLIDSDLKLIKAGNELQIIALEESLEAEIELNLAAAINFPIKLRGKIDRIDRLNGQKRIIDYKTGGVESGELNYSSIDIILNGKKGKALQLLVYQYLYTQAHPSETIEAGNISLRTISQGFLKLKASPEDGKKDLKLILEDVLNNLLDKNSAFQHTSTAKYCSFCKGAKSSTF
tara:strand:- start:8971 stop:11802 length:2832 start_codon:yes stop_codon:yes gene_type:complete